MSFRTEEKLYIRQENLIDFKKFIFNRSGKKIHKPRKIKSLYFDNSNLDMYNDSVEGIVPRKKIRIRNYPNSEDKKNYLEIKYSSVEGRFKTRKIIDNKTVDFYKRAGCFDNKYGVCMPNFYVTYDREYMIIDDVRISIDKNIKYENFKTNYYQKEKNCIIELKTSADKDSDELVNLFPFQRIRFSKYCFAVENCNRTFIN
tara:strand:+ start:5040 stop:5642 length:603 start_codon:yes stop_codon:yes gene_type:complete